MRYTNNDAKKEASMKIHQAILGAPVRSEYLSDYIHLLILCDWAVVSCANLTSFQKKHR
jgi:hypothetical protein